MAPNIWMTIFMEKIGYMINKSPIIIVDADAIIAQVSPQDNLHKRSVRIAQKIKEVDALLLYPITTVTEVVTYVQRVLSSKEMSYELYSGFLRTNINLVEVNKEILYKSLKFSSLRTNKKNTIYDCVVAAVAKEHKADAIFSFDKFYKKQGLTLVEDYFK